MKILIFSPHMGIWQHSIPEAAVAAALTGAGAEITAIYCNSELSGHCAVMYANRVPIDAPHDTKSAICTTCQNTRHKVAAHFGIQSRFIGEFFGHTENALVEELMQSVSLENYEEAEILGIPVGRYAAYEVLLANKKTERFSTAAEWQEYLYSLKNTAITLSAMAKVISELKPEILLVYNTLYGLNFALTNYAESAGIATYSLHAGENISDRLSTLIISRKSTIEHRHTLQRHWKDYSQKPVDAKTAHYIADHFTSLLSGQHFLVYSAQTSNFSESLRSRFKIPETARLLVATLSSYDERYAAETIGVFQKYSDLLFPKQKDWVDFLLRYAQERNDIFLVIRVHPRELPNKRDSATSMHAKELMSSLTDLPANVIVDWPDNGIPLYAWAKEADVFLNAWSSVGEEMSLLGLPVVLYDDRLILYPADLNRVGKTINAYRAEIDSALQAGWQEDRVIRAFRWYALKFVHGVHRIADEKLPESLPSNRKYSLQWVALQFKRRILRIARGFSLKPIDKFLKNTKFHIDARQIIDLLQSRESGRIDLAQFMATESSEHAEKKAIADALQAILQYLFPETGEMTAKNTHLHSLEHFVERYGSGEK